jgi:hypothetical protein
VNKENERKFNALLVSLRRMIYIPDHVDHNYLAYLAGIFATYELVYRQLLETQMTYVISGTIKMMTPYVTMAESLGVKGAMPFPSALVESMFARTLPSGYTLSQRVWDLKNYSADIEAVLKNGITNKLPTTTIAKQLDGFVLPKKELISPTPYGRTVSFDSMRLARTEVMEADRFAMKELARTCPWITGLYWELSASHSVECDCDEYASHGLYSEADAPDAPHPQCQCVLVPEMISISDWGAALDDYEGGLDLLTIAGWVAGAYAAEEFLGEDSPEG